MEYKELPERLNRNVIYESDYVCLYADKVKLPNGYIIEKYHQIHYPHEAVSVVIFNEKDEILLIQSKRYTVLKVFALMKTYAGIGFYMLCLKEYSFEVSGCLTGLNVIQYFVEVVKG